MSGPLARARGCIAVGSLAASILACSSPTDPSAPNILAHRAVWNSQNLVNYSYTYEFHAFNSLADQPLRVAVRQDTVRSVVVLATGDSIPPNFFPTIDALFDQALQGMQNGSLTRITFDPVRGYPTSLGYAALPDALSAQQASDLQPLP
jgi:hypothetical protein